VCKTPTPTNANTHTTPHTHTTHPHTHTHTQCGRFTLAQPKAFARHTHQVTGTVDVGHRQGGCGEQHIEAHHRVGPHRRLCGQKGGCPWGQAAGPGRVRPHHRHARCLGTNTCSGTHPRPLAKHAGPRHLLHRVDGDQVCGNALQRTPGQVQGKTRLWPPLAPPPLTHIPAPAQGTPTRDAHAVASLRSPRQRPGTWCLTPRSARSLDG
jgi:hypothetical protein